MIPTPTTPASLLLAACGLLLLPLRHGVLAFAPPPASATRRVTTGLFSTAEASTFPTPAPSSLEKLEIVKLALKRPRGASVGVEYAPAADVEMGDGDLSMLSMQLRKGKCSAIWTSGADVAKRIAAEQEGARGDFPGPVPVIYSGSDAGSAMGGEVAAVVLACGQDADMDSLSNAGIIWKVDNLDDLREAAGVEDSGGVFLLSRDMLPATVEEDADELKELLSSLPKKTVTIAPLSTMLDENEEIALGKRYAALGVSSLLLEGACVGDEEDAPYSQYAIEELNKKSSSSFSMTGLTGSTNGHFGVSSHGGEAKWRRKK